MRKTGVILVFTVTIALVISVIFFSFAPLMNTVEAVPASARSPEAALETAELYASRAATLQAQIEQLKQAMGERQTTYAEQLATLEAAQMTIAQSLSVLEKQDQLLRQQLDEVRAERGVRNVQYTQQLEQLQEQYAGRVAEIIARLDEAQARLAEANQLLGR